MLFRAIAMIRMATLTSNQCKRPIIVQPLDDVLTLIAKPQFAIWAQCQGRLVLLCQ